MQHTIVVLLIGVRECGATLSYLSYLFRVAVAISPLLDLGPFVLMRAG